MFHSSFYYAARCGRIGVQSKVRGSSIKYLVKEGLKNVWVNRLMSIASSGILTTCLLLLGFAVLLTANLNSLMGYVEQQVEIVVYIEDNASKEKTERAHTGLKGFAGVVKCDYVSKKMALEEIKSMAEAFDRPLDAAEADVLISITHWGMGKKKEAKERLLRLLIILYPRNFIRVIANEGKAILPVLQSLMKMLDRETERGTAFCQYIREVYLSTYAQSKRFRGITSGWREKPVKLSPQQKYVFALLSKGYKNAEIVKIAGLRLYTIKSYTRIIYQKLEVHNLMDAIIKAKQLGILK